MSLCFYSNHTANLLNLFQSSACFYEKKHIISPFPCFIVRHNVFFYVFVSLSSRSSIVLASFKPLVDDIHVGVALAIEKRQIDDVRHPEVAAYRSAMFAE